MEISKVQQGEFVEVIASGRLDESWASHLSDALDAVIREGAHRIRLNMQAVTYLSSAGIRILVIFYKQLTEIQGSFAVTNPSVAVRKILDMTRLSPILISDGPDSTPEVMRPVSAARTIKTSRATFEVLDSAPGASLECRVFGEPTALERCEYREEHMSTVAFPEAAFGLGLGAFGSDFHDCRGRFGEFLAVAGAATYLPTDGASAPDYLLSAGSFVPEVRVLYGIGCEGQFASLARFETSKEAPGISLSELLDACVDIAGADSAAVVMLAETAGLVGAALRRSPAQERAVSIFSHPEIRNWISFTAEPAYAGSLCLAVGIASREPSESLRPMLRPIGKLSGHFHAAVFPYRPIQKGELDLRTTVKTLFEGQSLQSILHMLADRREPTGAGESEFIRGACWIGPIHDAGAA